MRWRITAYLRWARTFYKVTTARAAVILGVAETTLRSWLDRPAATRLKLKPRGRPPEVVSHEVRQLFFLLVWLMGPCTGVLTLCRLLPQVPRREIEELLRRHRRDCWSHGGSTVHVLRWDRGTVWAMDFSEPPAEIDGRYQSLLLVRDLGSGEQLAALPVLSANSDAVCALLEALFRQHGAPLVMKCDNGSPFLTPEVDWLFVLWGVERLLSPPGYPQYNGACEAGIGSIKTRAHHIAARNGRPGQWTCDDVEEARLEANATGRPLGASSPAPDELWAQARRVTPEQRGTFQRTVRMFQWEVIRERGGLLGPINHHEQAQRDREAVMRALLHHGYLTIVRRRFSQPVPRRFRAGIR